MIPSTCGSWCFTSPAAWLFVRELAQVNSKENINAMHYIVKGIYHSPMDSPHKWQVMWKTFPCHDTMGYNKSHVIPAVSTVSRVAFLELHPFALTHWLLGHVDMILGIIFKLISVLAILSISYEISLVNECSRHLYRWWHIGSGSAWCCQAPIHYLIQHWPRFTVPYDMIKPQWINKHEMKSVISSCLKEGLQQSGTKPNVVAKILATKFGVVPDCSVIKGIFVFYCCTLSNAFPLRANFVQFGKQFSLKFIPKAWFDH